MTKLFLAEKTNERNEQIVERLSVEVRHYNGLYRLCVIKETVERGFVQFLLFADGNFNYTITTGRKSQKKLDTLNQIVEENKDEILKLWLDGQYKSICELVHIKAIQKKVA